MWNMMLQKLLANKKMVVVVVILFFILCIGVIIWETSGSKETDKSNSGVNKEQEKEDKNDTQGLEVMKPNEVAPEDSSDASGFWSATPESHNQTGDKTNTKDETDKVDNDNSTENDEGNVDDEQESDQEFLEDDITWGDIY